MKKSIPILLTLILMFTSVPFATAAPESLYTGQSQRVNNVSGSVYSDQTITKNVYTPPTSFPNRVQAQGPFTPEELQEIKATYSAELLQLAAFYYPSLSSLLTGEQLEAVLSMTNEEAAAKIASLTAEQEALMKRLTPAVISARDAAAEAGLKKQKTSNLRMSAAAQETPDLKMMYNGQLEPTPYKASPDGTVDLLHRTSMQQDVDVSLPGLHGLDLNLIRRYNSLNAKASSMHIRPNNESYDCRAHAHLMDCVSFSSQDNFKAGIRENFIATGWSLNIPTMDISYHLRTKQVKSANMVNYRPDEKEKIITISLDDGNSYLFRWGETKPFNHPYSNVRLEYKDYSNVFFGYENYVLHVNDERTYTFKYVESGRAPIPEYLLQNGIHSISNKYGDKITFQREYWHDANWRDFVMSGTLNITDTVGRRIAIALNGMGIQSIVVKDAANVQTNSIEYQTKIYASYFFDYGYTRLDKVIDQHNNVTKKSYTYYDETQWTADAIMEENYSYQLDGSGKPILDLTVGGQPAESSQVENKVRASVQEINYMLLKEVTDDIGFKTIYTYQAFDRNWTSYPTYEERQRKRGTIRMHDGMYNLFFNGYHPLVNVYYEFKDKDGATKRLTRSFSSSTEQAPEIWSYPKTGKGDYHLSGAGAYRSGDQPFSSMTTDYGEYTVTESAEHFVTANENTLKRWEAKTYNASASDLNVEEGTDRYTVSDTEVTSYQYDSGKTKPYLIKQWVDVGASDAKPQAIKDFLRRGNNRTLPDKLSSYASLHRMEYDDYGAVISEEDALGNRTETKYDGPYHQPSYSKTSLAGDGGTREKTFTYDSFGMYSDLSKVTAKHTYRDLGSDKIVSDTVTEEYGNYNALKVPTTTKTSSSGTSYDKQPTVTEKTLEYDSKGLHVLKETFKAALGKGAAQESLSMGYTYDNLDRLVQRTYSDGSKVNTVYDGKNRPTSETFTPVSGSARTTTVAYNDASRTITQTSPDGQRVITAYTPYGEVEKQDQAYAPYTESRTVLVNRFDATGTLVKAKLPYAQENLKSTFNYGPKGIATTINPDGKTVYAYYANTASKTDKSASYPQITAKSVEPDGKETWTYQDRYGRAERVVEKSPSKTRTTRMTYTPEGQVAKREVVSGDQTQTTYYGYDGFGKLNFVKDAEGQTHTYVNNRLGQLIAWSVNGVLQKSASYNELGWPLDKTNGLNLTDTYTYNKAGHIQTSKDKSGQTYTYSYTPYYEEDRVSIKNTAGTETYWKQTSYDPATRKVTAQSTSEGEKIEYGYDAWNRLAKQLIKDRTYGLAYDAYDRLQSMTYPDQKQVTYGYDNLNRINTVTYPGMGTVTPAYEESADESSYTLTYTPGMQQVKRVDAFKELKTQQHTVNRQSSWNETFRYDGFGNIASIAQSGGTTSTFTYDKLNRIAKEETPSGTKNYTYDDRGNRLTVSSSVPLGIEGSASYKYNPVNQLSGHTSENDVLSSYTYYGDGLRATKTVDGNLTRFIYVNGKVIEELDAGGSVKARNIWGNELLWRQDNTTGKSGYYFYNGHGDVVAIKGTAGNNLNTYEYDIWGKVTRKTEEMNNPYRYTGEPQDEESGLIYLRARYYDPAVGRFIQQDTYEGELNNPLTMNLYTYVQNNPLRYTDPSGHCIGGTRACDYFNSYKIKGIDYLKHMYYWATDNAVYKGTLEVTNVLILDDIHTLFDANATVTDKVMAGLGFVPIGKVFKGGKLVISLANKYKTVTREVEATDEAVKLLKNVPCNCFTAGTKVLTDEGEKAIEEIEIGDKVLAKSDETGKVAYKEVVGLFQKRADEIYKVHIGDEVIEATAEHPFWLNGIGWTEVKDLEVGDLLVSSDGSTLAIDEIEKELRKTTVYNFEVKEFHSYFVSNLGVWVHNCAVNWSAGNFASGKLDSHFQKHVINKQEWADLGYSLTKEGYLNKAQNLLNSNIGGDIQGFTSKNGYVFRYNSKMNEFATAKPDGTIETLFRPKDGMSYWQDQVKAYGGN